MTDKGTQILHYLQDELESARKAREKALSTEVQYSYDGEIKALQRAISFVKLLVKEKIAV